MKVAPVVLFVYNRPEHTRQTIEALKNNDLASDSEIFIFSDGPKNKESIPEVDQVRKIIREVSGFKKVAIIERERNWGLAANIIDGTTKIAGQYGTVIVLEDDLITSPHFLRFMNEALLAYKDEESVYSITGYSFTEGIKGIDSSYFLNLTSSWGWATWDKKWAVFAKDDNKLKKILADRALSFKFNYDNSFPYTHMARQQLEGRLNSWAIYWHACILEKNGLSLYPSGRLVQNIGHDGSGVHCGSGTGEKGLDNFVPVLTNKIFEDKHMRKIMKQILSKRLGLLRFLKLKLFYG